MTQTVTSRDVGDVITDLQRRVRALEQRSTVAAFAPIPALPTDPSFHTIIVNGELISIDSDPATGVGVTAGIFLDNIYLDISWTAAATANEYQIELARKVGGVYQAPTQYRTGGTIIRIEHLDPDTTYGVRVYGFNNLGLSSFAAGDPANTPTLYKDITTGHDSTTPSALTGFTVTAGFRSLVAIWNNTADFDFDYYDLQIATNSGFTTGVRNTVVRGSIGGFTDLVANTTYWVRARAVDRSGNPGPWTTGTSVTTQQLVGGDVPPLFIDSAVIANGAILNAKIGTAEVTDAKIGSISVAKINVTGTMTSTDFILGSGGQIKTATASPGFALNNQGFSLYNASAVRTVYFDATTGSATFQGTVQASIITGTDISGGTVTGTTIKTAATGKRIEMNSALPNRIQFFSGNGSESASGYLQIDYVSGSGQVFLQPPAFGAGRAVPYLFLQSAGASGGNFSSIGLSSTGGDINLYSTTISSVDYDIISVQAVDYLRLVAGSPSSGSTPVLGRIQLEAAEDVNIYAADDITMYALDDIAITSTDITSIWGENYLLLTTAGSGVMKLSDGTSPAYSGGHINLSCSGPVYVTAPELAIFGGKLTVYNSGYGIHINGTNATYDNLSGGWGGAGGGINGRSGHTISFEWDGTNFKIWVDSTNVRTL